MGHPPGPSEPPGPSLLQAGGPGSAGGPGKPQRALTHYDQNQLVAGSPSWLKQEITE